VGNSQFKKSISGGQKKRVSIGVELISNPHILIFDEPTSGLDSHNALVLVNILSSLAKKEGKLVITTIHQPSTLMFRAMDRLYLLKEGRRIYDGKAGQIVPYMESLEIKVNYRMNPADFFML
jgi:ABC-type multidrug transport system ATPase subunit